MSRSVEEVNKLTESTFKVGTGLERELGTQQVRPRRKTRTKNTSIHLCVLLFLFVFGTKQRNLTFQVNRLAAKRLTGVHRESLYFYFKQRSASEIEDEHGQKRQFGDSFPSFFLFFFYGCQHGSLFE